MFKPGDKVQYKNYEAEIIYEYDNGYTVRFRRGSLIVNRFCHADELKVMDEQMCMFKM